MALERELKYSSPDGLVPALAELSAALAAVGASVTDLGRAMQTDVYYDDAALAVEHAGLALRVRSVKGERLATLKSRGSVMAGVHERSELELPLPDHPDEASPPWPHAFAERLAGLDLAALRPRMVIKTARHRFHLHQTGRLTAELAFDEVTCRPAPALAARYAIDEVQFHEVELEAMSAGGAPVSVERLTAYGTALQELLPLYPSDITKLERAAALLGAFAE